MDIGIHGINGKMGRVLADTVFAAPSCRLSAASVREGHDWAGRRLCDIGTIDSPLKATSNLELLCQEAEVVIDFTHPDATLVLLPICQRRNRPMLIGTTGFNEEARRWIARAAADIPIVLAANTSLGVNVLMAASRLAARALASVDWDVEIFEMHHRRKVDAPSGTALRLGEEVAKVQQSNLKDRLRYPHERQRRSDEIGFSVARAGDVIGDHTVFFVNDHERIELTHRAQDRSIFARGALVAAQWLVEHPPGLYDMSDVLGFAGD